MSPIFWSGLYNPNLSAHSYKIVAFLNPDYGDAILKNRKENIEEHLKNALQILSGVEKSNQLYIDQTMRAFADELDEALTLTRGLLTQWEKECGTTPEALEKRQRQLLKTLQHGESCIEENIYFIKATKEGLI